MEDAWSSSERARIQNELNQNLGNDLVNKRAIKDHSDSKTVHFLTIHQACALASEIFGRENWSVAIKAEEVYRVYEESKEDRTIFVAETSICVRVTLKNGAFREDIGCAQAQAPTKHEAVSKSKLFAKADATKRALRQFGQALGNCLYDNEFNRLLDTLASGR